MACPPVRAPAVRGAGPADRGSRRGSHVGGSPAGGCKGGAAADRAPVPAPARSRCWPPPAFLRCLPLTSGPAVRVSCDLPSPCEPKRQPTRRPSRSNRRSRILGLPVFACKPRVFRICPRVTPGDTPLPNIRVGKSTPLVTGARSGPLSRPSLGNSRARRSLRGHGRARRVPSLSAGPTERSRAASRRRTRLPWPTARPAANA
jgi:hypothetical protein